MKGGAGPSSLVFYAFAFIILIAIGFAIFSTVRERFEAGGQPTITFYMRRGCGWCDKLKPELAVFEQFVVEKKINVKVVRSQDDEAAAEAAGVKGFPTIILTGGKTQPKMEYLSGDRSAVALEAFVRENI